MVMSLASLMRRARQWFWLSALALAACGGGGGEDGPPKSISMGFTIPNYSAQALQPSEGYVVVGAFVTAQGSSPVYLGLEDPKELIATAESSVNGDQVSFALRLKAMSESGTYTAPLILHACADPECRQELQGSPVQTMLTYVVKPNIKIQAAEPMFRTGAEKGPVQVLSALIPDEAQPVIIEMKGRTDGLEVSLDGGSLIVTGKQAPAGTYDTTAVIRGTTDSRYYAEVKLPYTVNPAPGGERGLLLNPSSIVESIEQGSKKTVTFRATSPTWSDAPLEMEIFNSPGIENIRAIGGDLYSFDINASSMQEGRIYGTIYVRSKSGFGAASLEISTNVNPAVVLSDEAPVMSIRLLTAPADFERAIQVSRPDGSNVRWVATVDKPWVRLTRAQGITGRDSLGIQFDQNSMGGSGWREQATLTLSLDVPGTLPREFTVSGYNDLPLLQQVSVSALFPGRSMFYVAGYFEREGWSKDLLRVEGAKLVSAELVSSPSESYPGDLRIEVDEVVMGRPVTLSFNNPLTKTAISIPVVDRPSFSTAFAMLPRAEYRPVSFGRKSQTAVFAGGGAVWRWEQRAGLWQVPQSRTIANLIDAAIAPSETVIYALRGREVVALSPSTLNIDAQATLTNPGISFDHTVPSYGNALVFTEDGRAQVVYSTEIVGTHGVNWLAGNAGSRELVSRWDNLVDSPVIRTGGYTWWSYSEDAGPILVKSASGTKVLMTGPTGTVKPIPGWQEFPTGVSYQVQPQTPVISVSDDGQLAIQSDGQIRMAAFGWTSTSQLLRDVPLGYEVGGYGLSGDGRVAVVYGYRKVQDQGQLRATDAKAWMIDLRQIPVGAGTFKVLSEIPLPSPVGCITKLDADESCAHRAHVQFLVGDRNAFILGPRGIVALPLPEVPPVGMTSARVPAPKGKKSLAPIRWPASR